MAMNIQVTVYDWAMLYADLIRCHRDLLNMTMQMRLEPNLLYDIYTLMLSVRERWLRYRHQHIPSSMCIDHETYRNDPERMERDLKAYGVLEEQERLQEILLDIKRLLVAAHRS
jgi:hypothetical protein